MSVRREDIARRFCSRNNDISALRGQNSVREYYHTIAKVFDMMGSEMRERQLIGPVPECGELPH